MRIVTLEPQDFDTFARSHKYESYFQTSDYANFEANKGYKIHYLGFLDDDDNLVGAAMCLYKKLFWNYNFAYIPRGLLIDYDNPYLVNKITLKLKKLLYKQNYVFIKIDPPVIASEKDFSGKTLYLSNTAGEIINTLKNNNYKHMGFNLNYETKLPRFNVITKLNKDTKEMFSKFNSEVKENIRYAKQLGIKIIEEENNNIDTFFELIKYTYGRIGKKYFTDLYSAFKQDDKIDIFYTVINSQEYVKNANKYYNQEEETNRGLGEIIKLNDRVHYNIEKVINDKMESDKRLEKYKNDVINATNFLRKYPDSKILGASLVIKHQKGADCLILYEDKNANIFKSNPLLISYMCEKYANEGLKYLILGPTTGNFDRNNPRFKANINKMGFNSSIIEYIGEFDLIINPLMYKIHEHKLEKDRKKRLNKKR